MTPSKLFRATALLLLCAFAISASAATTGFSISVPATVNGTQLAAGDYTLKWEANGETAEVSIEQAGKVVATTSAKLQALDSKTHRTRVYRAQNGSGNVITRILPGGKKLALVFEAH